MVNAPFPFVLGASTASLMDDFDTDVYNTSSSSLIYKMVDALCGSTGAGQLLNQNFINTLQNDLSTTYGSDLDYFFGNIGFLPRAPSEMYTANSSTDLLTSDEWDQVAISDAWYRARISDFWKACNMGGTPEAIRMTVQAAVACDCNIYEDWRYIDCADETTEILTRDGYRHHTDLKVGDEVLTLNTDTGLAEWQPALKINVFPVVNHEMLSVEMGGRHSSLTTMNHRWPVSSRIKRTDGSRGYSDVRIRTSGELSTEDRFIRSAPLVDLPEHPKYVDSLVELIGWFLTEGYIHAGGDVVTIVQSHTANPDKTDSIRAALISLIGPAVGVFGRTGPRIDQAPAWREWVSPSKPDITVFRLNTPAGRLLTALAPDKVASMEFVTSLTKAQLTLFLDTCIAADGHVRRDGYRSFIQKSMERTIPVQVAATLLGIPTSIQRGGSGDCHVLSLCERQKFVQPLGQGRKNSRVVRYTGTVWCPTTPNGTWFARRSGSTYFTGNSFGLTEYLGRADARNEVVIQPLKGSLEPQEFKLLRDMLARIMPVETIVTINPLGLAVLSPVSVNAACANSTYFEVQKMVTPTPIISLLPSPAQLAIELLESERWLFSPTPRLAPHARHNFTAQYSNYYLMRGGKASQIDSVTYSTLNSDGTTTAVPNFIAYQSSSNFTPWTSWAKADSPDNWPGGRYGIHPDSAPALNADGTPYNFPWDSQADYVTAQITIVLNLGGNANEQQYQLPVQAPNQTSFTFLPEYAVAYFPPGRDSTVSANNYRNRQIGESGVSGWTSTTGFIRA